jgi:hypothetical protein
MRFRLPDGETVEGRSYSDVVMSMSDFKMNEPRSLTTYMHATARRTSELYNVIVDASTPRSFVLSLEAAGLMQRLS